MVAHSKDGLLLPEGKANSARNVGQATGQKWFQVVVRKVIRAILPPIFLGPTRHLYGEQPEASGKGSAYGGIWITAGTIPANEVDSHYWSYLVANAARSFALKSAGSARKSGLIYHVLVGYVVKLREALSQRRRQ